MITCENISVQRLEDPTMLKLCIATKGQKLSFELTRDIGYLFLYELYAAVDLYGDQAVHARTNN